jgi:sulfate adenylyltransferase (ADP) / ATP adenylyltransferase
MLPDDLYRAVHDKFESAVQSGSLIYTQSTQVPDTVDGIQFRYTLAPSLSVKPVGTTAKLESEKSTKTSPLLPPDQSLEVVDEFFEGKYSIVLNKFAVSRGHFMVITKDFKPQDSALTEDDLGAAFQVLQSVNRSGRRHVGFFNSGSNSGASVAHKHIQFIELPSDEPRFVPFADNVVSTAEEYIDGDRPLRHPKVPFAHYIVPAPKEKDGESLAFRYSTLLSRVITILKKSSASNISYNLVFTEEWLMATPRTRDSVDGRSINSVGTIGLLLAKSDADLQYFKQTNPLKLLENLGLPFEELDGNEEDSELGFTRY